MKKIKTTVFLILTSALFIVSAHADILFIDVNDAPAEIAAAQKAADARHEKLVVIPDRSKPEQQAALKKLRVISDQVDTIMAPTATIWRNADSSQKALIKEQSADKPDPAKVAALTAKTADLITAYNNSLTALQPQMDQYAAQMTAIPNLPKLNSDSLNSLLASYHTQHKTISSIIISGHHGDDDFTGYLGDIKEDDIRQGFAQYPEMYSAVRSVYGWGCYSATLSGSHWWFNAFPNVALVGGFDAGAPSSAREADTDYLFQILTKEKQLIATMDIRDNKARARVFSQELHAIGGFDETNGAACTRSDCVGINTGVVDMSDLSKTCNIQVLEMISADLDRANQVLSGSEDPPCNTQNSWLRTLYNNLRQHEFCATQEGPNKADWAPVKGLADTIVQMIFWGQIQANVVHYYQSDFDRFAALAKKYDVPAPDMSLPRSCNPPTPGAKTITPKDISALMDSTQSVIGKLDPANSADMVVTNNVLEHAVMIQNLKCVPFTWVEPPRPTGLDQPLCDNPLEKALADMTPNATAPANAPAGENWIAAPANPGQPAADPAPKPTTSTTPPDVGNDPIP
jgi:hypothetical protein